nr:unnamed protein product [Callosobruchus chinensis]
MVKTMEITRHSKYSCSFCGKDAMKRSVVGIWFCKRCKKVLATTAAASVRSAVRRLRETREQ